MCRPPTGKPCRSACIFMLLLALSTTAHARSRSGSSGRGSSGTFRSTSESLYRAPAARPYNPANPFAGSGAYSRPGYRPARIIPSWYAGYLVGSTISSLQRDQHTNCNGVSVQCYKQACQEALSQCSIANSTTLVTATCPEETRFRSGPARVLQSRGQQLCWESTAPQPGVHGVTHPDGSTPDVNAP